MFDLMTQNEGLSLFLTLMSVFLTFTVKKNDVSESDVRLQCLDGSALVNALDVAIRLGGKEYSFTFF